MTDEELAALTDTADSYHDYRTRRLALEKEARALQSRENALKAELIYAMTQGVEIVSGRTVTLTHTQKPKHQANDWEAIHKYIYEENAIDLVQRRLTESAVTARLEDGITIPGIETVMVDDFSIQVKSEEEDGE